MRGYKDGVSTRKEWLLGQIDHSVPAVETPPGRPAWYYGTSVTQAERTSFDTFVSAKWERPTAVYVGSRDGMLHAFDGGQFRWGYMDGGVFKWGDNPATSTITEYRGYFKWDVNGIPDYGTGNELWAFIPSNLISRLKNNLLLGQDQAYVDASPALSDVYINNAWKTVLLSEIRCSVWMSPTLSTRLLCGNSPIRICSGASRHRPLRLLAVLTPVAHQNGWPFLYRERLMTTPCILRFI